jgi:hypothetical protein
MNDLFRRFNSEVPNGASMSLEDLEQKSAEIRGQLNATVENPQLMRRSALLFSWLVVTALCCLCS